MTQGSCGCERTVYDSWFSSPMCILGNEGSDVGQVPVPAEPLHQPIFHIS